MKRSWTDQQRAEAIDLALNVGKAEAARRLGIPPGTVGTWLHRAGHVGEAAARMRPAIEQHQLTVAERKGKLAERMLTKAEAILAQLDAEVVEKHVKVVSMGGQRGSEVEIVEVTYDRPPTADQKRIVDAVAVLVDKIQLLTGEATSRPELLGGTEPADRTALTGVVLQLAQRAAA